MPRAGPLKQILRSLSVNELKPIQRKFCPRVKPYSEQNGKKEFVDSLRNSLHRSIEQNEVSYEELMSFIRKELSSNEPKHITTKIRNVLQEIEISKNAGYKPTTSVRERWIASELFQALRYELKQTPYKIELEKSYGRYLTADIVISHQSKKRNYAIEVKLAGKSGSRDRLPMQIGKYKKYISHLKRIFVFLVAQKENHLPENHDTVSHVITQLNNKRKTEVIVKHPRDLRYTA